MPMPMPSVLVWQARFLPWFFENHIPHMQALTAFMQDLHAIAARFHIFPKTKSKVTSESNVQSDVPSNVHFCGAIGLILKMN